MKASRRTSSGPVYPIPPHVATLLEHERMAQWCREEAEHSLDGWSYVRPVLHEHPHSDDDEPAPGVVQ